MPNRAWVANALFGATQFSKDGAAERRRRRLGEGSSQIADSSARDTLRQCRAPSADQRLDGPLITAGLGRHQVNADPAGLGQIECEEPRGPGMGFGAVRWRLAGIHRRADQWMNEVERAAWPKDRRGHQFISAAGGYERWKVCYAGGGGGGGGRT
jgi:hypothetical protein